MIGAIITILFVGSVGTAYALGHRQGYDQGEDEGFVRGRRVTWDEASAVLDRIGAGEVRRG